MAWVRRNDVHSLASILQIVGSDPRVQRVESATEAELADAFVQAFTNMSTYDVSTIRRPNRVVR
jgi:hypothetical protein